MAAKQYDQPELYELAFGWRDYSQAVDFLCEAAAEAGLAGPASMVELGCGPGQYCREFAKRGVRSFGIDLSPEMVSYAQGECKKEDLPCEIIEADFCKFHLPRPVDLACCMMATFSHLLTNKDTLDHFEAVANNLTSDGLYIIELPHPRDIYEGVSSTKNVWEMEEGGKNLEIDWASDETFDPITGIDTGTVHFRVKSDDKMESFSFVQQSRRISLGLFRALVERSGRFHISNLYGDIKTTQPFDNSKKSWRLVAVLRKFS
ncbi:MAG: class I SAM-dependent methyltransferase [Candidatus Zixiibacteriota bacterium]